MTASTQSCAELLPRLPVLGLIERGIRRSGTTVGIPALIALAALDGAPAPVAPSPGDDPDGPAEVAADSVDGVDQRLGAPAETLLVDLSVAGRQVTQLIEMGAVQRVLDPPYRRVHLLRVTPSGHRETVQARRRSADHLAGRLSSWSDDDLHTLVTLLGRLQDDLGPGPRTGPVVPPPASLPRTTSTPSTES